MRPYFRPPRKNVCWRCATRTRTTSHTVRPPSYSPSLDEAMKEFICDGVDIDRKGIKCHRANRTLSVRRETLWIFSAHEKGPARQRTIRSSICSRASPEPDVLLDGVSETTASSLPRRAVGMQQLLPDLSGVPIGPLCDIGHAARRNDLCCVSIKASNTERGTSRKSSFLHSR